MPPWRRSGPASPRRGISGAPPTTSSAWPGPICPTPGTSSPRGTPTAPWRRSATPTAGSTPAYASACSTEVAMTSGSPPTGRAGGRVPEPVLGAIDAHLQAREQRRSELYQKARQLRRLAQGTMGRMHEGHPVDAEMAEIRKGTEAMSAWLAKEGRGDEGLAHDALQESVEAQLLYAVIRHEALPGPAELSVEPEPYLMGLGDLVGEVRRLALDRLAAGDVPGAEAQLTTMEHLYRTLLRFDTTRAIVALKPKQDVARSLLERTRGDVTMAKVLGGARRASEGTP